MRASGERGRRKGEAGGSGACEEEGGACRHTVGARTGHGGKVVAGRLSGGGGVGDGEHFGERIAKPQQHSRGLALRICVVHVDRILLPGLYAVLGFMAFERIGFEALLWC